MYITNRATYKHRCIQVSLCIHTQTPAYPDPPQPAALIPLHTYQRRQLCVYMDIKHNKITQNITGKEAFIKNPTVVGTVSLSAPPADGYAVKYCAFWEILSMLPNITDAAKYFCLGSLSFHELCTSTQASLSWSCSGLGFAVLDMVRERSCRAGGDSGIFSGSRPCQSLSQPGR